MNTDRRAIFSLVAHGRITTAEAERLIAACSYDREAWWVLAGCALCAGLIQLHPHVFSAMEHFLRTVIDSSIPALHHAVKQAGRILGVNL